MINFNVGVILPAAGCGERFGVSIPKQYYEVLGKPLFLYALEEFRRLQWVKKIVLVVDNPEHVKGLLEESHANSEKICVVQGENTRHRSIRAGVQALQKNESDLKVVIVHDAARPLVPSELIEQLVVAAEEHGAAGSIRPLVSTVLRANPDGFLDHSLDRSKHVSKKTNQVCIMAPEENDAVKLLVESLESKVSLVQCVVTTSDMRLTGKESFNTVVFFHLHEIDQDNQLLDFASMLDVDHQSMSVYDLHRTGRNMAKHHEKLQKGVVVIHCLTPGEERRLAELVVSLVLSDSSTFSGQTFFI
ncbi:hypothetical protein C0J52_07429 [Blattella germanica]|nr:hypothetical protein C0J52_07429 [Blattella germanica]